ncbi:DUF4185 domain-containing protein [Chitinophaga sp.]|uniref:DUF4185 domain-containing protein n=1 Tax=Chitinophaga sp. TaxID=1869181 RepID=UPI002CCA60AA|nr:DUF4185 domain-containing protein [Chitinophaga sp.]HWV66667.1 DUF4185 domain-containing protein [Chitinophaga sp.]
MITLLTILISNCCAEIRPDSLSPRSTDTTHLSYTVAPANDWNALFTRESGWFGGDGIFSIPLNGVDTAGAADSTLLLFSDSMTGTIRDGKLQPDVAMIHNSAAVLKGNAPLEKNIRFWWNTGPAALFEPHTPAAVKDDYYWLGDGFVNHAKGNDIYITAYRIRNISNKDFGFAETGNAFIVLPAGSKPPFTKHRQLDTPLFLPAAGNENSSFGAGILVNTQQAGAPDPDGYVYVYGIKGQQKEVLVARVLPENIEHFERWYYWNRQQWSTDIAQAAAITAHASNELSVTPLKDGRYALICQVDGMSPVVGLRLGLSPAGPFGPVIKIWECPEVKENKHFFVYNAKAHPNLSKPGELLISYNVNAFDFLNELAMQPQLYRPRFIRLTFQ